jgi:hypothetical protein
MSSNQIDFETTLAKIATIREDQNKAEDRSLALNISIEDQQVIVDNAKVVLELAKEGNVTAEVECARSRYSKALTTLNQYNELRTQAIRSACLCTKLIQDLEKTLPVHLLRKRDESDGSASDSE